MVDHTSRNSPVLVVGLGRFGAATAGQLQRQGREVLAIDTDPNLVQKWAERVTHTAQLDATNVDALKQIGAEDFQLAVVAVGTSIEASVLVTSSLVELGVPQIWAKAMSSTHGKILARIGAHHVVYPEAEAGERIAHLLSGTMLDFIQFDDDFVLAKLYPPKIIHGLPLEQSLVRSKYRVTVVGVKTPGQDFTHATADTIVSKHDLVIVSGRVADVERFASIS